MTSIKSEGPCACPLFASRVLVRVCMRMSVAMYTLYYDICRTLIVFRCAVSYASACAFVRLFRSLFLCVSGVYTDTCIVILRVCMRICGPLSPPYHACVAYMLRMGRGCVRVCMHIYARASFRGFMHVAVYLDVVCICAYACAFTACFVPFNTDMLHICCICVPSPCVYACAYTHTAPKRITAHINSSNETWM